ncbi:hypothetical protein SPONN_391 [uncultured Candidatus Thioglobus sp.]|nr:hypothetical protein SPONN_391 [uncultured Candidatus Thioglobus sp.]
MNKKPNLFIVFSPLQIINAIEAIHHFKCKNNILLINYKPRQDKNNAQMDDLVGYHKWDEIIKVGSGGRRSKFLIYVKLIKRLKKVQYDHVFVAGFTSAIYTIVANLKKNKLFFMDDGVGTITAYHDIFAPNVKIKLRLKHMRFWLFGIRTKFTDKINIFTYFDLQPLPHVAVIPNKLRWFSKNYTANLTRDKRVYFLGHPHDDKPEIYLKTVECFLKKQNFEVVYIPHRFEKINKSLRAMFEKNSVKVEIINMPVEMYFLINKIMPNVVVGFYTSAFFVMLLLYPTVSYQSVVSLSYDSPAVKDIYKRLASKGVEILNYKGEINA